MRGDSMKSSILIYSLALGVLLSNGCGTQPTLQTTLDNPATVSKVSQTDSGLAPAETDGSAELAYKLAYKKWCTNNDACSLMIYMVGGKDRGETFKQKEKFLQHKAVIPSHWKLAPDEPVTKGTFAYMLCRATDTRGGLFMRILGGRRYAYREAVYQDFMQAGSEYEPLTGPEAVGIIGRVSRRYHNQQMLPKGE